MLAPQQAAVLLRQRGDLVGDLADQPLVGRVLHVQRRSHVEYPSVDMAEHAVGEAAGVEQGTELGDIVGQVLRWHRGVLDEGQRPPLALDVTKQAHGALTHAIDPGDLGAAFRQGIAQALDAGVLFEMATEDGDPLGEALGVVVVEFHQVDAVCRGIPCGWEELGDVVPDKVLHGQPQHLVVHRFDGGRARLRLGL